MWVLYLFARVCSSVFIVFWYSVDEIWLTFWLCCDTFSFSVSKKPSEGGKGEIHASSVAQEEGGDHQDVHPSATSGGNRVHPFRAQGISAPAHARAGVRGGAEERGAQASRVRGELLWGREPSAPTPEVEALERGELGFVGRLGI